MSQDPNTRDDVEIPEGDDSQGYAEQRTRRGLTPATKFGLLIGSVALILGGSFIIGTSQVAEQASDVNSAPRLDATPGGALQAESPRFQEILRQANDQRADEAAERGETFIPTPESVPEEIETVESASAEDAEEPAPAPAPEPAPEPEPEPEVRQTRVVPAPEPEPRNRVQTTQSEEQENPYLDAMVSQMGAVSNSLSETSSMRTVTSPPQQPDETAPATTDDPAAGAGTAVAGVNADTAAGGDDAGDGEQVIPAGEVLYAETITSSSSDLPGPVLVEVTTGEFEGSRLIGSFSTGENVPRMIVQFSSMTLPDGESIPVSAYAVDGRSAETAVASDVNRRYIQRYAPILAATFITGYANAAAQPGQTVVELGDGTSVVRDAPDEEQSLYAGAAAAADAIGSDLIQNAPQGPEVTLRSGWPVGVMFTAPVTR